MLAHLKIVLMSSTLLASKVRCSISVLENSSTSVVLQSRTPLRGMPGGAATSIEEVPGMVHPLPGEEGGLAGSAAPFPGGNKVR